MNMLLDGMPEPRESWTVREIAQESGRSLGHVSAAVRSALVPPHLRPTTSGRRSNIPAPIASDLVLVLRHGVFSSRFVELIQSDPATAREAIEALERLMEAADSEGEAAAVA